MCMIDELGGLLPEIIDFSGSITWSEINALERSWRAHNVTGSTVGLGISGYRCAGQCLQSQGGDLREAFDAMEHVLNALVDPRFLAVMKTTMERCL